MNNKSNDELNAMLREENSQPASAVVELDGLTPKEYDIAVQELQNLDPSKLAKVPHAKVNKDGSVSYNPTVFKVIAEPESVKYRIAVWEDDASTKYIVDRDVLDAIFKHGDIRPSSVPGVVFDGKTHTSTSIKREDALSKFIIISDLEKAKSVVTKIAKDLSKSASVITSEFGELG